MIAFDASTLILLAKAELLDNFLENIGQPVAIPKEVERECCGAKRTLDSLMIQKVIESKRIKVIAIKNKKLCETLRKDFPLGSGEAEAISLAMSEKASLVAIDDKHGINACKLLGLPFTTAIDILVRMSEKKLLSGDEAQARLASLEKHGRYSSEIARDARSKLEGR